jgi:beta-glucosidase
MNRRGFLKSITASSLLVQFAPNGFSSQAQSVKAFPKDFRWGVATAAYQIEGGVNEGGRGKSIWDTFTRVKGAIQNGDTGDVACDHYHLWREDVQLMKRLGVKNYRFSIAWPRVVPNGAGPTNQAGLDFYERLVDELLKKGIEPFVTLYHWDLPQALQDKGGWANRETTDAFASYIDVVSKRLSDRVKFWATHNEPMVVANLGHTSGEHAPGIKEPLTALKVSHHLLLSHGKAVQALRANDKTKAKIGIVNVAMRIEPASDKEEDVKAAKRFDGIVNRWYCEPVFKGSYPQDALDFYAGLLRNQNFLSAQEGDMKIIQTPIDFLGLNYYTRLVIGAGPDFPLFMKFQPPQFETTEMGWEVYPNGLYEVMKRAHQEYAPKEIFITENGAAYKDELTKEGKVADEKRVTYLHEHFLQAHRAIQDGVPLKGYFVWSLMDNFEWAYGYSKRFGLVHIDYTTQKRTVKRSGEWYAQVMKQNSVPRSA